MSQRVKLAIVSDIHYAGSVERTRHDYEAQLVSSPWKRAFLRTYRHFVWMRDPFAHNHLLDLFITDMKNADLVVANGDYSCDSAMIGVADDGAFTSALECLGKLRAGFGNRLQAVIGDHEFGKFLLVARVGGLRLAAWNRTVGELALKPTWKFEVGNYVLIGVTSTLAAMPIYEAEALPDEVERWRELATCHLKEVEELFREVKPGQRILFFCHDPTALPFLLRVPTIRERLPQIERTIIGHLHTQLVLRQSRLLAGIPVIKFMGGAAWRLSSAVNKARDWKPFNVLLCPSLAGAELLKDGGYYEVLLTPDGSRPAEFIFHPTKQMRRRRAEK